MKTVTRLLVFSSVLLVTTALRAEDKPTKPAAPAPVVPTAPAAASNISGTWNMEVQTAQGTGTPVFTFVQDGDKLTGHYKGRLGEADVTGSIKGDAITFSFKISPQGQEVTCTYSGTVTGDTMKGTAKFGTFADSPFTGKKQVPAAK
jgi:hypothetical protein